MYRKMLSKLILTLPRLFLILFLLLIGILPVGSTVQAATSVQPATPGQVDSTAWYDGTIQYSIITNCVSIIQGAPYQEYGAGTYVGFLADPDNALPYPNTTYYLHVVVAGLGNACSGMRAYIDLGLPANTSLAIDNTNKVNCFYNNQPIDPPSECPQVLPASAYNPGFYEIPSPDSAHAYTWPIPQGSFLEIQIPVQSSTQLTNSAMVGRVWMLDGNDNPWLQPQQGVYVFSSQPSILYPSPSTTSIKDTTAHSEAYLYTHGLGGTGYFDLGTDTSYGLVHEPVTIPAGGNAFLAWDDWGPPSLSPDTLYHWRFTFTPTSGSSVIGADQTFRTLLSGVAVVGSGITGSCTEAGLQTALATGFPITFACGPLPATIALTSALSIASTTTIDGGNLITLSTTGASNHFNVQSGANLTLAQIALNDGSSFTCGGSIHVMAGGQLTLTKTSFNNNTSFGSGGAVCIEATGSADIHSSTFTNNQAMGGGAVFNGGTLLMDHSRFTTNSSSIFGGALQNYGTGTVDDTSFVQNTAEVNGGGIDAGGVLTILRGTFISNTTGIRGGGINVYGGNLSVTESSFINNQSSGYGGGIANDASNVTIQTSEFSGNTAVSVGGGLRSNGTTTVINSTFSGNHSDGTGGGIDNSDSSGPPDTLSLVNTTLFDNTAGTGGGNLYLGSISSANVTLMDTLVDSGTPSNCDKAVTSLGYNLESANSCGLTAAGDLVNTDPMLGPLQNNGGSTRTHALLPNSPAIDTANTDQSTCPSTDQRGKMRPFDGNGDGVARCDMGAYEFDQYPPSISDIPGQFTDEDISTPAISFTVGDLDTPVISLTLTADSSNQTLIPLGNIVLGGSGVNRNITLTPAPDLNGSATITVTVFDGESSTSKSFLLTVNPINDAPNISVINNQSTNEDTPTPAISFTVSDIDTHVFSLTLTADSSNQTLIPIENIIFGGSGTDRTITLTPSANLSGSAMITITVSDGELTAFDSFLLTINPVNDAPIAVNNLYSTDTLTTLIVDAPGVLGNDIDPENDPLTTVLIVGPTHGKLNFNSDGSFNYIPNSDFVGTDSFTYKANDGSLDSNIATVTITITTSLKSAIYLPLIIH